MIKILLVGDRSDSVIAHLAIPKALDYVSDKLSMPIEYQWLATDEIDSIESVAEHNPGGLWCVPGSPYRNMEGALTAIRYARESKIAFLGTCGGFQHALIEYARNVLNISDADHAESNPGAEFPLISKLSCALVNKTERLRFDSHSAFHRFYGAPMPPPRPPEVTEAYQCSYSLNPVFLEMFDGTDVRLTARSATDNSVRGLELKDRRFFIGTLFQPERSALEGRTHPLIVAFVQVAMFYGEDPPRY